MMHPIVAGNDLAGVGLRQDTTTQTLDCGIGRLGSKHRNFEGFVTRLLYRLAYRLHDISPAFTFPPAAYDWIFEFTIYFAAIFYRNECRRQRLRRCRIRTKNEHFRMCQVGFYATVYKIP